MPRIHVPQGEPSKPSGRLLALIDLLAVGCHFISSSTVLSHKSRSVKRMARAFGLAILSAAVFSDQRFHHLSEGLSQGHPIYPDTKSDEPPKQEKLIEVAGRVDTGHCDRAAVLAGDP